MSDPTRCGAAAFDGAGVDSVPAGTAVEAADFSREGKSGIPKFVGWVSIIVPSRKVRHDARPQFASCRCRAGCRPTASATSRRLIWMHPDGAKYHRNRNRRPLSQADGLPSVFQSPNRALESRKPIPSRLIERSPSNPIPSRPTASIHLGPSSAWDRTLAEAVAHRRMRNRSRSFEEVRSQTEFGAEEIPALSRRNQSRPDFPLLSPARGKVGVALAACPPVVFLRLEENTTGGRAASATLDARRS
jgi:hypothetical protein